LAEVFAIMLSAGGLVTRTCMSLSRVYGILSQNVSEARRLRDEALEDYWRPFEAKRKDILEHFRHERTIRQ
jgi:hypothetical protein